MKKLTADEWLQLVKYAFEPIDRRARSIWREAIDMYRFGVSRKVLDEMPNIDIPVGNMVFVTMAHILSAMLEHDPDFVVQPRKTMYVGAAKAARAALNYWYDEVNPRYDVQLALAESLLCGYSILLSAYHADVEYEADVGVGISDTSELRPSRVKDEGPVLLRVPATDFCIDPAFSRIDDARWVCRRFLRPIDEVRDNPLYENTKDLHPSTHSIRPGRTQTGGAYRQQDFPEGGFSRSYPLDEGFVWLYEITVRDKVMGRRIITIAEGHDKFLRNEVDKSAIEGHPYYKLETFPMPDDWFSVSDFEQWKPLAEERARLRGIQLEAIKRMLPRIAVQKDTWKQEQIDALANNYMAIVPVDSVADGTYRELFQGRALPSEMFRINDMNEQDFMLVTGINEYRRGIGGAVRTATEAELFQQGWNALATKRYICLAELYRWIGRTWLQSLQEYGPDEKVIALWQEEELAGWRDMDISRSAIQGEYQVRVEIGRLRRSSQEARRQLLVQLSQQLMGLPFINGPLLARKLLEAFSDELKGIEDIVQEPTGTKSPQAGGQTVGPVEPVPSLEEFDMQGLPPPASLEEFDMQGVSR